MVNRIGVFACGCGPNIKEMADLDAVSEYAKENTEVVLFLMNDFYCNADGKQLIADTIKKEELTHVVMVSCSPKTHLETFEEALEMGGINPYNLQMVNAREQCTWVTPDASEATEKIKLLLNAALKRVVKHEELVKRQIEANSDVVIIGGGAAGIEAAINLASAGNRKVYVLEKDVTLGGMVVKVDEVYPTMECAPCLMAPRLSTISKMDNVEIITNMEISDILGYFGAFKVKLTKKPLYVDPEKCIGCQECYAPCPVSQPNKFTNGMGEQKAVNIAFTGAVPLTACIDMETCLRGKGEDCTLCAGACPFEAFNFDDKEEEIEIEAGSIILATGSKVYDISKAPELGYKKIDDVITTMDFEMLISNSGPTDGQLVNSKGEEPKSFAVVHCAGSRNPDHLSYCSGVCCMNALKTSKIIKHKYPDAKITELYVDMNVSGKDHQAFYEGVKEEGVEFVQLKDSGSVSISKSKAAAGPIKLKYTDVAGQEGDINVDMVVLSTGLVPSDGTAELAEMLQLTLDKDGFITEDNASINAMSTTIEGVYIAGCCQYPKNITESVNQSVASSGKISSKLVPGKKIDVEVMVAEIDKDVCSGCEVCLDMCPYKAISKDEEAAIAVVNDVLCHGCGTCTAACPSGAARSIHFTDEQIYEEIEGVLS